MDEVTYNVFLVSDSSGKLEVLLTDESVEAVEGAVRVGNITHPSDEDPLGFSDNHVLYQHIRQMLYHLNRDGEPSFWPDNITDMSRLTIKYQPVVEGGGEDMEEEGEEEGEEPEEPEDPETPEDPEDPEDP